MQNTLTAAAIIGLVFILDPASVPAQERGEAGTTQRPNILLIISDDVGTDVTSDIYPGMIDQLTARYGPSGLNHPDFQAIDGRPASTPNLAQLARQGMRFTNVWAHPFCSPTRAALITGLFAAETKVANYQNALSQSHTTFVQLLKDEGYSTAVFGKWHLAGLTGNPPYPGMKPKEAGFEIFKGNMHAAITTFWDYGYQVQVSDTPANEWLEQSPPERSLPGIAPTTFAPVVKVADTIEWIGEKEANDPDKPWFAWLAFNLSHATSARRPSQMAVPNADTLDAASREEMEACGGVFGSQDVGNCSGEAQMRAMTNALDTVVGKLLDAVNEIDEDTYVIYIGDNGTPMYGRPGLDFIDNMYITRSGRGKGTVYESGAQVPMVVTGPGIDPNSENSEFAHAVDMFATVLELAGLDAPTTVSNSTGTGSVPLAGVSLAPILLGHASRVRDPNEGYILTETHDLMRGGIREVGARNGTHKVLCTDEASMSACEFFDVATDPLEEFPLAKPAGCDGYVNGDWSPVDPEWHFCRLTEVVASKSFL
jgi:arylsulfatase A-like enzyme